MASSYIRKRNKKYSAILEVGRDAVTGKKIQKSLGSFNTKKEADIVLTAAMAKVNSGDYILPQKMKVKDFLNTWLETYAKNLSPTTYNGYKIIVNNHLNPAFGELEIQKLQPIHFQQYYNTKSETLKGKTLIQHHRVFRKALDYAWKNQLITRNPADMVDAPKVKKYTSTVLTPSQAKQLLAAVKNTRFEAPVNLGLSLGLRRGEILGLRWSDIDFINKTINIEQTLVLVATELIFKEPKTEGSKRSISAPLELLKILSNHKKLQNELCLRSGGAFNNKRDIVCTRDNGDPINPSTFSRAFGDFIKKYDLPYFRLHDLRHTNATFMLLSGTSAKVASNRLGHSTINITMDLYSHVLKDMNEDAADRLNDVIYN